MKPKALNVTAEHLSVGTEIRLFTCLKASKPEHRLSGVFTIEEKGRYSGLIEEIRIS